MALTTSAALAGAWEEFESLCLLPMENISLAQPTTLEPYQSFKNDGDTYTTYKIDGAKLAISDGRAGASKWCWIDVGPRAATRFSESSSSWSESAQADVRYELIDKRAPGFLLRSTSWREPKLDVTLSMRGKGSNLIMRVEETDLES
ncbi:hypothetical protein [Litoreibacter janthinus]|nr:hypothetical protein [Litoreibacter janthinus]